MSDPRVEAVARELALLEPGEDWPSNEALGGSLTGTRDDEFRSGMLGQAAELLAVADGADAAAGITRTRIEATA